MQLVYEIMPSCENLPAAIVVIFMFSPPLMSHVFPYVWTYVLQTSHSLWQRAAEAKAKQNSAASLETNELDTVKYCNCQIKESIFL